jgi:hypothetical protein
MRDYDPSEQQLTTLPDLSRPQLLDLWGKLCGRVAPLGIRRELMILILAYRIQEKTHGGLKPATQRRLS